MSDINAIARVDLDVNGKKAEDELNRLKTQAKDYQKAMAEAAAAGDKISYEKWKKELKKVEKEVRNVQDATRNVEDVMRKLDSATPKELKNTLSALQKQLQNIERGSKAWDDQVEKIRRVKAELAQVNAELTVSEGKWGKVKRAFNDFGGGILAAAGAITGLAVSGKMAVDAYAEMEQEMANVRKYTGMTEEEVAILNEEFKKMDTRSGRDELNKLAQEAGRLGKTSVEDVLGFVKAADKINVALDDLGDGATLTLSKLTQIFGDEQRLGTEKALLSVGSVINELSQNCAASAPYLAQFAARMGGVGAQAGMTVQQIMGIAAVLDSKGQQVESSSTAIAQVITRLFQDSGKYAKAAGLDVKEFADLVQRDANEALLTLATALNEKGGLKDTAPLFKEMGENGSRTVATLATLAQNIDEIRKQQQVANEAFEEAISIDNEFNVQNETVQASLEKAKYRFTELTVELGQKLMPVMKAAINTTNTMMRAFMSIINFIVEYRLELLEVATAIGAYTIAVNAATIKTKLFAAWTATCKAGTYAWMMAQQAFNVVTALCTANTHRLTQEFKLLAAMLKTNPWGLALTAITAIVVALTTLIRKQSEVTESQKALNKIKDQGNEKLAAEKSKIDLLVAAAQNEKLTLDERQKAIAKLNSIIPGYNAQLDATSGKYKDNKKALDAYLESLRKKYELEGAKEQLAEIGKEKAAATVAQREAQQTYDNVSASAGQGTTYTTSWGMVGNTASDAKASARRDLNEANAKLAAINAKEKAILDAYGVGLQKEAINEETDTDTGTGNGGGNNGSTTDTKKIKDRFAAENEWRATEEAKARIAYATGETNYLQYTERMNEIALEFYDKQLAHSDLSASERLKIEASKYEQLKKMADAASSETLAAENEKYSALQAEARQAYLDGTLSKETYDQQMINLEIEHQKRMIQLTEEGSKERLSAEKSLSSLLIQEQERRQRETQKLEQKYAKIKESVFGYNPQERLTMYNAEAAALQVVYDRELKAAGDNADEKLRIEEAYLKAKLALQKQYNIEGETDTQNAMQSAVATSMEWLEGDGGKALSGTMNTLVSGMSAIFSQMSSIVQSELEIQTAAINKRYNDEIAAAEGNSYQVAKLEKKKEEELAKAKNEANKKMFAMQVIQAVAQTAMNALSAYGSAAAVPLVGYILAPIAAGMALAAGAIQIAAIKKQQQASEAQGYAQGGFTGPGAVNQPAGIVHAGEWVASQKLVNSPQTRPLIDALEYAQRNNSIGTLNVASSPMAAVAATASAPTVISQNAAVLAVMGDVISRLTDRLDEPFITVNSVTGDTGIKQAEEEYDKLIRNKTPKNKK